ncbi:MAG: nitroreductase family deazaflavin-dependent oxidoreductase [Pseudomonadales bacterium]|nr:nitroreductase family deazaflavin-dependent oxidoreductase [Pseudomonadales bacterium]MCP5183717.1 nitroreductase family deazaflavin-dependent oxidoreductase [Pseudomonadales bacterium]
MSDLPASMPKWIADHIALYRTDPDAAHLWDASLGGGSGKLPTLLLTTIGRHSGLPRPLPLIYGKAGDAWVIVASKGGAPAHPSWYDNLVAEPHVTLQAGREIVQATARTATGDEREALWKQMAALYPPYDDYQKRAGGRRIPVVVLERRPAA